MPEPIYTDIATVNDELGVILDEDQATRLIVDAEDAVDSLLGGWPPDRTTGRKIVETSVDSWQWALLRRATTKMAAVLYANPGLLTEQGWDSQSGPDFTVSGRSAPRVGSHVIALLDQSCLRRIAGRAVSGPLGLRPDYQRFLRATRHDGT
jgi:hypothetical protein